MGAAVPLSSVARAPSTFPAGVDAPHADLAGLSKDEMALARNRWIAQAAESLPNLTPRQRDLARDRRLVAEVAYWQHRAERFEEQLKETSGRLRHAQTVLTPEDRALARDKKLASKCSDWRIRYLEAARELEHERRNGVLLEEGIAAMQERIARMERLLVTVNQPAESAAASA